VILAKWLLCNTKVLLLDEPTRGVDIGAKVEIYHLINALVEAGVGVLLISSEMLEVLGMSDRILVMREGRLVGDVRREEASEEVLLQLAAGVGAAEGKA
jgi:ABC-type sugar transport system ATPase subunit